MAICFLCHQTYHSNDRDDCEGDGKCNTCKEKSKKIAYQIDIKMAEIRRKRPLRQKNPLMDAINNSSQTVMVNGRAVTVVNAKDIGLKSWGN